MEYHTKQVILGMKNMILCISHLTQTDRRGSMQSLVQSNSDQKSSDKPHAVCAID